MNFVRAATTPHAHCAGVYYPNALIKGASYPIEDVEDTDIVKASGKRSASPVGANLACNFNHRPPPKPRAIGRGAAQGSVASSQSTGQEREDWLPLSA
jgi:hypothetical protein